jgi:hypothetical protein
MDMLPRIHLPNSSSSDHNPLDLIEAELVAPAIVELRRTRRGMVRHRRRLFERAGARCRVHLLFAYVVARIVTQHR